MKFRVRALSGLAAARVKDLLHSVEIKRIPARSVARVNLAGQGVDDAVKPPT
jgi:hypothetical protein